MDIRGMPSFLFACGVASPFRKCDSGRTLSHLSPTTFLENLLAGPRQLHTVPPPCYQSHALFPPKKSY